MTCSVPLKSPTRTSRGFTLLEVLVSLTIMGLITGVAFAGFSVAIQSWERGSRKIAELDRRFALERLLQRQIGLAYPGGFRGTERQLEFTSSYSLANGPGYPVRVKYESDGNDFLYSEIPIEQYVPGSDAEEKQIFAGLAPTGFHYLQTMPNGVAAWTQETEGLPMAARVELGGDILVVPMVNRQ